MKWLAWAVLLLGLSVVAPAGLRAQEGSSGASVELGRNYPNPFNPETFIPFALSDQVFADGHQPVVSVRIYNVLAQLVAIPIVQNSGEALENLRLDWNGTGSYTAYWDGKLRGTDREAPSGVYVYQLIVDGKSVTKKMTIVK